MTEREPLRAGIVGAGAISQIVHVPILAERQDVDLVTLADVDPAAGIETRKRLLGELAGEPILVIGTHFSGPTAGHVIADGDAWRLVVDERNQPG